MKVFRSLVLDAPIATAWAAVRAFVRAWLDLAEATSQQALLGGRS